MKCFIVYSDTVSRSGIFSAIATTIDRCKTEGVVDVFQVVKALRIHKPGAVLNVVCLILKSIKSKDLSSFQIGYFIGAIQDDS